MDQPNRNREQGQADDQAHGRDAPLGAQRRCRAGKGRYRIHNGATFRAIMVNSLS